MSKIITLIYRDIILAFRSGTSWLLGIVFFISFLALCAIALGGDFDILRPLAPALIWLALLFSLMFSFDNVFGDDAKDGSLAQIKLSALPMTNYVIAKFIGHFILAIFPLLIAMPFVSLMFDLSPKIIAGLVFSTLLASPALICYGGFAGACLTGLRAGGFLLVLISLPLLVPILIFAIEGSMDYENNAGFPTAFKALAGISLISIPIGIIATSAALKVMTE